jgi:acyl carrier protein
MWTKEGIDKEVASIIEEHLDVVHFEPNERFKEDLHADSLDLIELTTAVEMHFDVNIPDAIVATLLTPALLSDYLVKATAQ